MAASTKSSVGTWTIRVRTNRNAPRSHGFRRDVDDVEDASGAKQGAPVSRVVAWESSRDLREYLHKGKMVYVEVAFRPRWRSERHSATRRSCTELVMPRARDRTNVATAAKEEQARAGRRVHTTSTFDVGDGS